MSIIHNLEVSTSNHDDLIGVVHADISSGISYGGVYTLDTIARYFKIDVEKYKPTSLYLSVYGLKNVSIYLKCIDLENSKLIQFECDTDESLDLFKLFEQLNIVLVNQFDNYSDLHNKEFEEVKLSQIQINNTI